MKKTKIIIALLLAVLLICTAIACIGCNKKDKNQGKKDFVIGVISDPQIVAESDVGDDDYASFLDFNAVGQKMLFISEAILKTAVDKLIEEKVNVVLIPGDLTENGSKTGHQMVASQCARLEAAGIPVYVVCGNHDINKAPKKYMTVEQANAQGLTIYETFSDGTCSVRVPGVSPAEFMEIYHDYGFENPIARDTLDQPLEVTIEGYTYYEVGTMSYVQDLPGSDYRLISLDAANYYEDENEDTYYMTYYGTGYNKNAAIKGTGYSVMTERLLAWTEEQLMAAENAGKKPIVMAHFPINNQMGEVVGMITDGIDNRMNMTDELLSLFSEYNVKYTFTGHLHTQHITVYNSNFYHTTVTDIETGCLTNYPLPMRYVTFGNSGVNIRNEYLTGVKAEYLPAYLNNDTIREAVTTDIQSYALDPFIYDNLLTNFDNRINDDGDYELFHKIFSMLELDPDGTHGEDLNALAEYIYNDLYKAFMTMPIYKTDGKNSVEAICEKYGIALPKNEKYVGKGVFQFFIQLLGKFYKYDYENDGGAITYDSAEGKILRYGVYSIFDVLAGSELFTRLHAINPDVEESVISSNFLNKLFKQDTLDLLCDDFVFKLATVLNPLIKDYFDLSRLNAGDLVDMLNNLLPTGLGIVEAKFSGLYDKATNTILGVPLDSFLKIGYVEKDGSSVPTIEIYFDVLLRDVVFDKVGNGVLN